VAEIETRADLFNRLAVMGKMKKETRNKVVCAMIGHSLIVDGFFGEVYCGRCGAKIADQLMGSFANGPKSVRIGHNCETCRKNYKALTWKDKIYVPNPFKPRAASRRQHAK